MQPEVMQRAYSRFKEDVLDTFTTLHGLAVEAGDAAMREVAEHLLRNLSAPFLFVVVGEVKSGKSSFINALLGDTICEVAPDPCTDRIQKIVYSDTPYEKKISEHVAEIGLHKEILREVAIVDTPGTNSIIAQHQEITERFIPEADLIIFVFPAINPYSQTAWDLFSLVHARWHKKIVFVLQQADRATAQELEVNEQRVRELARQRGVREPMLFRISAKQSWDDPEGSGMAAFWDFVRATVTGGRHYLLKMESLVGTATSTLADLQAVLQAEAVQLKADHQEEETIRKALERGQRVAEREVALLSERLLQAYDRTSGEITEEFEDGLSLMNLLKHSFGGILRPGRGFKDWLEGLNKRFDERFSERVEHISRESADRITEDVAMTMERLLADLREGLAAEHRRLKVPKLAHERFAVAEEAARNLQAHLSDEKLSEKMRPQGLKRLGDQTVMGGFLTAVGAIIAATTHAVVFDVTGGIVTTVGALLAINTLALKRRSIIRRFKQGFHEGRERFHQELEEKLPRPVQIVFEDLENTFDPLFTSIHAREEKLADLTTRAEAVNDALDARQRRIDELRAEMGEPSVA